MDIIQLLLKEIDAESATTRKMLQRVPTEHWDWKPHEKSMSLARLACHITELPQWIAHIMTGTAFNFAMALTTTELDFAAQPYSQPAITEHEQLMQVFEKALEGGKSKLLQAKEEDLAPAWTLCHGEHVLMSTNKYGLIRHSISQTIHHRAQLGVYLRLLNIPIPGSYGPSADEANF